MTSLSTDEALRTRKSVRAFLSNKIEKSTVQELLTLASRSPSGSNIQPWTVHVFSGDVKSRITQTILQALQTPSPQKTYKREWNYYPLNWREPFLGRRRKIGWDLYSLLGIPKGDLIGTENQRKENYKFFGAPVGMIFTLEDDLEIGSWLDLGIFIGSLTIAARGRGLDTCAQAAFADFHELIRPILSIPSNQVIICGLALGYGDAQATINQLATDRADVNEFSRFEGFD